MIRLLTAVLLFASFNVVAEVTLTDINNNEVADADEVMGNFNALKQGIEANATAIEALPTPPTNCTADQIIKWDDTNDVWGCATDPFAGLNCDVGDQLRMGSGGWECRAEPLTASLSKNSWERLNIGSISAFFDNVSNVTSASYCELGTCYIVVPGVADHTSCIVQVTGDAVGGAFLNITTSTSDIRIRDYGTWADGQPVYINISCAP